MCVCEKTEKREAEKIDAVPFVTFLDLSNMFSLKTRAYQNKEEDSSSYLYYFKLHFGSIDDAT